MEKTHKIIFWVLLVLLIFIILTIAFEYRYFSFATEGSGGTGTGSETDPGTGSETDPDEEVLPFPEPFYDVEYDSDGNAIVTQGTVDAEGNLNIDSDIDETTGGVGSGNVDVPWTPETTTGKKAFEKSYDSPCSVPAVGSYFTFNMLKTHGDYLCNGRGMALRGEAGPSFYSLSLGTFGPETVTSKSDIPSALLTKSLVKSQDPGDPSPLEIYILAFATHESGGSEYTAAQLAWWGNNNSLRQAAKEFQDYVKAVSGKNKPGKQSDGFFNLKYNPKWIIDTEDFDEEKVKYITDKEALKSPTVEFNTSNGNEVIIGDFAIDYVHYDKFSFINDMYLETNDPQHKKLTLENNEFQLAAVDKSYFDKNGYPLPGRPFKIIINNKYNATKITNIHVNFSYSNAKGSFTILETHARKRTVTATSTDREVTFSVTETVKDVRTQPIVVNINVTIKAFDAELNRYSGNEGQVEVQKIVVDENGNNIPLDVDKFYEFKVTVGNESEILRVKANSTVTSKVYRWERGTNAPKYTVEELNVPDGTTVEINGASGNLTDGKTVIATATNKIKPKSGMLTIEKKVVDEFDRAVDTTVNTDNQTQEDKTKEEPKFDFNVTIKGKFKHFDGKEWRRI